MSSLDKKKKINTKKSKEKKENQINLHLNKDNKRMNIKNININTNKIINARYNTNSFSKGKLNDAKKHKNNKIINIHNSFFLNDLSNKYKKNLHLFNDTFITKKNSTSKNNSVNKAKNSKSNINTNNIKANKNTNIQNKIKCVI